MFCTGVENSVPTIQGGKVRIDEMESCHHYERWKEDFALVGELGVEYLRYGPPIHTTLIGPEKYDWSFADKTFAELKRLNITPIVDLCHFGVPDWLGNFQNPDFPQQFCLYAKAFAERFPWIQLYTPVNEMYICAMFSAKYGWWNEQLSSDQSFVMALKHIVKANVLAMAEIVKIRSDAIFIQSESSEYFHAESPAAIGPAEVLNSMRFLSLDLKLWAAGGLGDVRVPARQRHDPGRVPFLLETTSSSTASWVTTTTSPMSTVSAPTGRPARRARSSATRRSPGNTTSATACR